MKGFKTLVPIIVTDDVLVSSTVLENEHPQWTSGVNYTQFSRVIYKHVIYEDGLGGVSTTPPDQDIRWNEVDPSNQWRIFDPTQLALTSQANSAQYVFKPGKAIDGLIALEQEDVSSIRIRQVNESNVTIFERVISSIPLPQNNSYYSWFAGPLEQTSTVALQTGFVSDPKSRIIVDFNGGPDMKFGPILFGDVQEWGIGVRTGGGVSYTDYSVNEANAFGRIKYVARGYAPQGDFDIVIDNKQLDDMNKYFLMMRRNPAALIPSDDYASTIFYGRLEFSTVIAYKNHSEVSLTLRGLVKND